MSEKRVKVHSYKCVDCDRVLFAFEEHLPTRCPFCTSPSVIRLKEQVEVVVHSAAEGRTL